MMTQSHALGSSKRGPKRRMSPEQELFIILTRLRYGILEQDRAARWKLPTSHISRIYIIWIIIWHLGQISRVICQVVFEVLTQKLR